MLTKIRNIFLIIIMSFILITSVVTIIFRFVPIPTSSFMVQKRIKNLIEGNNESINYDWVSYEEISANMKLAVIAAEDQKFFDHFGFDFGEIKKAIDQNKKRKVTRGASTITQQTAKNLFLWSDKSFIRKGLEVYFTLLLEILWSKERILEVYLNIAEFGNNVYGVGVSSVKYFKMKPNELTKRNSAMLAAVLPNPQKYHVNSPTTYQSRRIFWIQKQMTQLGFGSLNHP